VEGFTLMLCVLLPLLQLYVPPGTVGVAVNVAVCPLQIVTLFTVTLGVGFTVTVEVTAAAEHPDGEE
jgi:hypothetical protein